MQWPLSQSCYAPAHSIHAATPFSIRYSHPCGPFTIALKAALPPFDRRWRGGALERSSHTAHMATRGFAFHVGVGMFMFKLPGSVPPPLKAQPGAHETDEVYNEAWTAPHVLTRIQLEDMRTEPEHVCDILPNVPPMSRRDVAEVIKQDGFAGETCQDHVAPLQWWAVPGAQRPAVMPGCGDTDCVALEAAQFAPVQLNGLPPQAHVAMWALGGAAVAWAAFAWMWGTATRRGSARSGPVHRASHGERGGAGAV